MRYERVHQLLKNVIKGSQNFTALTKQIANRWSILNLIKLNKLYVNSDTDDVFVAGTFNTKIPDDLSEKIDLNDDLFVFDSIKLNHLNINKNEVYLYEYSSSNSLPIFIIINYITKQNNTTKIFGHKIVCLEIFERILC